MKYLIIANEFSGTDKGRKVLAETETYFSNHSLEYTLHRTEYTRHATQLTKDAVSAGYKFIIGIGGDGTFNEIVNGLDLDKDSDVSLAFIPSGSGNDFVRNTNLKGSTTEILDYIFQNHPTKVDCCIVNDTKFINMCGLGLDVELVLRQQKIKKVFKGQMSYYLALMYTIFAIRFRKMRYSIDDGELVEEPLLLLAVGNGTTYGGGLPIAPLAEIRDGFLDVCVIKKLPRLSVPRLLIKFLKGKHIGEKKYVNYYKCKKLYVECDSPYPVNIDGELFLYPPCKFEIVHQCLNVYI